MIIQHNMQAMNANRMLGKVVTSQSKSTEKLSSGYRINRAADDAAGLAISEKMRGQIRGLNRASLNAQDGISLIQTAEGALNESQSILQRMRELSVQAANETNTEQDRENIQVEINQLTSEINRIGNTTEFNTKKLLKGNDQEAVTSDMAVGTVTEGEAAVVEGMASNFKVIEESVLAKASSTVLEGAKSTTTGKATDLTVKKEGKEAEKASATVLGLKFEAAAGGKDLNNTQIILKSGAKNSLTATDDANYGDGKLEIILSEQTLKTIKTVSDLNSKIGELLKTGGATTGAITAIKVEVPEGESSEVDISEKLQALMDDKSTKEEAALSGGTDKTAGVYTFDLDEAFSEAGDTITVAGYTFKIAEGQAAEIGSTEKTAIGTKLGLVEADTLGAAVKTAKGAAWATMTDEEKLAAFKASSDYLPGGNAGQQTYAGLVDDYEEAINDYNEAIKNGTIRLGTTAGTPDLDTQGADMAKAIKAKLNEVYGGTAVDVTYDATADKIMIKEQAGFEGKVNLDTTVTTAGFGGDETLTITDELGQNLQIKLDSAAQAAPTAAYTAPTGTDSTGTITITLSQTKGKNTADAIEAVIKNLTGAGVDFSKFSVKASDDWEDDTDGSVLNRGWSTMTGGVAEVKGEYSFNISKAMKAGETLVVGGQTFTAVEKDADTSKGEFNVGTTMDEQLNSLANAMRNNEAFANYNITFDGAIVKLVEKKASGVDLDGKDLNVTASGVQGEFTVDTSELLKDGASLTIDGEAITVSSKNAHSGYADGTAIKEAETAEEQAQALADAINKNAALSTKYTASVDGDKLVLTQKFGSEEGPSVSTTSSTKGNFGLKLQIGANTGQSMTLEIRDARANALGVSGDGTASTVTASDGSVAAYTEVANVNNGSDNNNIEYALDVSTFDHASAATAVIDDALNELSKQRAELGAFQNRLEYTITNLDNTSENLQSAESTIRDVNMADEMLNYSKNNILQQAAQSMLAQANQSTQGVLSLLQ